MRLWIHAALAGTLLIAGTACEDSGYSGSSSSVSGQGSSRAARTGSISLGSLAPEFKLWDLNGKPVSLVSHRGRVVLLNFWATWCGPCRVEMPAMEMLYREFHRKGFEILAVSTDRQGSAVTRPFTESLGLTFPILHDSDYRVGVTYGARTLPMTFLVDRHGIIRHRIFGARDWHSPEARHLIQTLLNEL